MPNHDCPEIDSLRLLNVKLGQLQDSVVDVKAVVMQLTIAVGKVDLVNQDHEHTKKALERLFSEVDKSNMRIANQDVLIATIVRTVEVNVDNTTKTTAWADKVMWAAAGMGFAVITAKVMELV